MISMIVILHVYIHTCESHSHVHFIVIYVMVIQVLRYVTCRAPMLLCKNKTFFLYV